MTLQVYYLFYICITKHIIPETEVNLESHSKELFHAFCSFHNHSRRAGIITLNVRWLARAVCVRILAPDSSQGARDWAWAAYWGGNNPGHGESPGGVIMAPRKLHIWCVFPLQGSSFCNEIAVSSARRSQTENRGLMETTLFGTEISELSTVSEGMSALWQYFFIYILLSTLWRYPILILSMSVQACFLKIISVLRDWLRKVSFTVE